jgi:hypothetical protein
MGMSRARRILTLALLAMIASPLAAEEILHFKSGAAMPVVSHRVDGAMVHVDLGDNGFMAFPLANIDRVEIAGPHIILEQSTMRASGTSVMRIAPDPTGDFPVKATARADGRNGRRFEDETDFDPAIEIDERGVAAYRPMSTSQQAAKRELAFTGNRRVRTNSGTPGALRGARQVGTRQVIGPTGPRRSSNPTRGPKGSPIFEFTPSSSGPAKRSSDSGSTGSSNDSSN